MRPRAPVNSQICDLLTNVAALLQGTPGSMVSFNLGQWILKRVLPTVRSGSFEKSELTNRKLRYIVSVAKTNCIFIFRSFLDVYKTADRETPL